MLQAAIIYVLRHTGIIGRGDQPQVVSMRAEFVVQLHKLISEKVKYHRWGRLGLLIL
jgi:hypothetical protein